MRSTVGILAVHGAEDVKTQERFMSAMSNPGDAPTEVPTVEYVMASPATSFWMMESLKSAVLRDPVDAINDAELLLQLLQKRLDDMFYIEI